MFSSVTTSPGPRVSSRPTRLVAWMYSAAVFGWPSTPINPRRGISRPTEIMFVAIAQSTRSFSLKPRPSRRDIGGHGPREERVAAIRPRRREHLRRSATEKRLHLVGRPADRGGRSDDLRADPRDDSVLERQRTDGGLVEAGHRPERAGDE